MWSVEGREFGGVMGHALKGGVKMRDSLAGVVSCGMRVKLFVAASALLLSPHAARAQSAAKPGNGAAPLSSRTRDANRATVG